MEAAHPESKFGEIPGERKNLVCLRNPQRKKGRSLKLKSSWEGPCQVVKRINEVVYQNQRSPKINIKVVDLDRLAVLQGVDSVMNDQAKEGG